MKTVKTIIIASAILGAGSAFAANGSVDEYLMDSHLINAETASAMVVNRAPTTDLDPVTGYLVDSGLIEAPTMKVEHDGMRSAGNGISADFNYWESPAS